jgi:hypothetical protein
MAAGLSVRAVGQEAEQALEVGAGVFVDMLGHLVIHELMIRGAVSDHGPVMMRTRQRAPED